jgi:hypothetical protein
MDITFVAVALFHIFFWLFVLLAFLNPNTARINLYYIIPITYVLHTFPFHFLNKIKSDMHPDDWEERADDINKKLIIPKLFTNMIEVLQDYSFASPLSPQGLLLFGAISSAYKIKC